MTNGNSQGVKPTVEDKQRLDILSKEINERLEEFSNIISKTLAIKPESEVSGVSFENKRDGGTITTIEIPPNTAIYCDPPGVCTDRLPCPGRT